MEKIITYENLRKFTYVNDTICKKPIKGIVISHATSKNINNGVINANLPYSL